MPKNHARDSKNYTHLQLEKTLNKHVLFSLLILFCQLVIQRNANKMWWVAERQNLCHVTAIFFSKKKISFVYREFLVGNHF